MFLVLLLLAIWQKGSWTGLLRTVLQKPQATNGKFLPVGSLNE